MLDNYKIVILHNIISPYKNLLFKELQTIHKSIEVLYMAQSESDRHWHIDTNELTFPHRIMFEGSLDRVNTLALAVRTWKELNSSRPDVLVLGGYRYSACWAGFLWARLNRKRIVFWSASNEVDKNRTFLKEKLKGFLVRRCHAANVYGQKSREYLVKLGLKEDAIFIKGNATDNDFYHSRTSQQRAKRDSLRKQFGFATHNFLYMGRFSKVKNILHLLKAYERLRPGDDWGLVLVGDGLQREEMADYIKQHALKNVLMPGFQQEEEIPKFLAASDVLVLPSISEPWGLVVNEAMASGLPVLVSKRCGCHPELIKEGVNGFSFDPFDNDELFELMQNVVDGKYDLTSMGEASLDIIKDYTPSRAAKIVSQAIEFALNGKK
jgi:glycosyltransferase involved in cell wall biosynthesis